MRLKDTPRTREKGNMESTFKVYFNQSAMGGSLIFTIGKGHDAIYPIYVPVNRHESDWDLTETFYPDFAEIMTDLQRKEEVFTKFHIFPNKINGRAMVIHHASTNYKGRFIQTLQIEEVMQREQSRLKHSYTFYVTSAFVKDYREAMKRLHGFLTSDMMVETPRANLLNPMSELVKIIHDKSSFGAKTVNTHCDYSQREIPFGESQPGLSEQVDHRGRQPWPPLGGQADHRGCHQPTQGAPKVESALQQTLKEIFFTPSAMHPSYSFEEVDTDADEVEVDEEEESLSFDPDEFDFEEEEFSDDFMDL